jgi:hypothetical protein
MLLITDGNPRGLGYVEIDHRQSPIPAKDLPPGVSANYFEADTYTCSHCQVVVVMNPARVRARHKCGGCNHHICDPCAARRAAGDPCKTFQQIIDEVREAVLRQTVSGTILP